MMANGLGLEQLGRYKIIQEIGSGSFGRVYLAEDTILERRVALKVLHPQLVVLPEVVTRFMTEAKTMAKLDHPGLVGIFDLGEIDGRFYLAMIYIEGQSLAALLEKQKVLPWEQAIQITRQVADTLQYAHDRGFVHRDVKPGNILIHKDKGAVLTDFGLAKSLASSQVLTRTGTTVGTPEYMANEVINGQEASPASDQFALACVLVEMLTGASPFTAPTPMAVIAKHTKEVELPDVWDGDVPAGVTAALRRAFQRDPQERHATISNFTEALAETAVIKPAPQINVTTPQITQEPQMGDEYQLELPGGMTMDFMYVPAGEFWMGEAGDDADARNCEIPLCKVYLDGYWIGKYPVTNEQYWAFVDYGMGIKPTSIHRFDDPLKEHHPVVGVRWDDAVAFCVWLSYCTGETIELPTEAQWEKAARGIDKRFYPWGNRLPNPALANYGNNIGDSTPVGSYPAGASPYGALDMAGNGWEWCADWYDSNYYKESPYENPQGPTSCNPQISSIIGEFRVMRGCRWDFGGLNLRVSHRDYADPNGKGIIGFRCVRSEDS